jgi:HSP20 family molecular chaperone IbpA
LWLDGERAVAGLTVPRALAVAGDASRPVGLGSGHSRRFAYRVTLPDQVDPEGIEAKLNDGVLTVRVPKSERAQRRRIEVTS